MGPYEIAALYFLFPIIVVSVWLVKRFAAAAVPEPEFETWCHSTRPTMFALRFRNGGAATASASFRKAFNRSIFLENHRGRYPWSRYLFSLEVEVDEARDAIVGRVSRCAIRRGAKSGELGATLDALVADAREHVSELWVHDELRADDDPKHEQPEWAR